MTSRIKVSVILTSYNKPQLVGKAIESVLQQTMGKFELFVMDDNSNMETVKVIHSYLSDPRIHFFRSDVKHEDRHKKTRYAVLINQALSEAKGDYISYLTDDNIYDKRRLEMMSNFLDEHSQVHVVYSAQKIVELDKNFREVSSFIRQTEGILSNASERVDHCSIMHRRSILKDIYQRYGSFWDDDKEYWGFADAVFWKRLNEFYPFYPINQILDINYRTILSYKTRHLGLPSFTPGEIFIPNGMLVKGIGPQIFYVDDQKIRAITDQDTFRFLKFKPSDVLEIPDPQLFQYPKGEPIDKDVFRKDVPNNLLIKSNNQHEVYLTQNRQKRLLVGDSFHYFGYRFENVITLAETTINSIKTGPVLSSALGNGMLLPDGALFKYSGSLFLAYNNKLHPIKIQFVMDKLNLHSKHAIELSQDIFLQYAIGKELTYHW